MNADSTSNCVLVGLDPQIAVATVAILGALSHFLVAVIRAWSDAIRAKSAPATWVRPPPTTET